MTQPADHGKNHQRPYSARTPDKTTRQLTEASPATAALVQAVRDSVGDQNYRHWFQDRSRLEVSGDQLTIFVPNPFICTWLMKRFRRQLTAAAVSVLGLSAGFVIQVDATLVAGSEADDARGMESIPATKLATNESAAIAADPPQPQTATSSTVQLIRTDEPAPLATRQPARRRFRSFRSFVSGSCNELSLMAAQKVCSAPGECFNPLYLHGTTGVGKSHLLEATYSEIRKAHPELNVLFLTSESFTNYFTQALASRSVPSFRQRFRNVDVLLIDNIEFLGNKKATQEEFLHTIDQLIDHGGQLVLTSDRHPRLLTKHREELTTRFVGGLVCKIERPAESTRQKLVESLALPHRQHLTRGALQYVATHGGRNARELQGSVNSLVNHATLKGGKVTTSMARSLLSDLRQECRHLVRISDVERIVCEAFGVSVQDVRSSTRRKAISCPRSVAMYVARKLTKAAWREIGQYFGGRDHSTVVAAAKRVDEWIDNSVPVELPNSCRGTTWSEVVQEIEERILALAS